MTCKSFLNYWCNAGLSWFLLLAWTPAFSLEIMTCPHLPMTDYVEIETFSFNLSNVPAIGLQIIGEFIILNQLLVLIHQCVLSANPPVWFIKNNLTNTISMYQRKTDMTAFLNLYWRFVSLRLWLSARWALHSPHNHQRIILHALCLVKICALYICWK